MNPNAKKVKKAAERIWKRYTSPRTGSWLDASDLLDLIEIAAGGRTYLFASEAEHVRGVKTITASVNCLKPNKARFDRGVDILLKSAPKFQY